MPVFTMAVNDLLKNSPYIEIEHSQHPAVVNFQGDFIPGFIISYGEPEKIFLCISLIFLPFFQKLKKIDVCIPYHKINSQYL